MRFGMRTLDDFDVKGKTILCRIDINVPLDEDSGHLRDTARLEACVPTIRELTERGGRVVLLAHQGSVLAYRQMRGLEAHREALSRILGRPVPFLTDVCGPAAVEAIGAMQDGDLLLLDNVRYHTEEGILFERQLALSPAEQANTRLVRTLSPLADLYVCDAFAAAHRSQPSLCGFPAVLPSAMGRLFEKEVEALDRLTDSAVPPCVFVLGGAKVENSFQLMQSVLHSGVADRALVGGLVGLVLLWAEGYDVGSETRSFIASLGLDHMVEAGYHLMESYRGRIVLPTDCAYLDEEGRREAMLHALPPDALVTDIGAGSARLFRNIILEAGTVFVNGPMGVYEEEPSAMGTQAVWQALGEAPGYTVIGGNDSLQATQRYGNAAHIDHISTGGRVFIRLLSGEESPVIQALRNGQDRSPNL